MRQDDWITKLYIMETINKQTFSVPTHYGYIIDIDPIHINVEWFENVNNFTRKQLTYFSHCQTTVEKHVEFVYDNEKFLSELNINKHETNI